MVNVDWESQESHVLVNPSYPKDKIEKFKEILKYSQNYLGHIWLSTSGSTSQKWVGLSKQALIASAEAVNVHIQAQAEDRWIQTLPEFHVGGLGIGLRASLSKSRVYDFKQHSNKWNAQVFYDYIKENQGTLVSLVPTQLFDLINLNLTAPDHLRAVIIGGGALLPELYERGVELKWPLLPSYGSTECASQIATAKLESWKDQGFPSLHVLNHIQVNQSEDHILSFSGPSLLSAYAYVNDTIKLIDPKKNGWFKSEDRGVVLGDSIQIFGRKDSMIKILGENVDLAQLEQQWQSLWQKFLPRYESTLTIAKDLRIEHAIHLVTNCFNEEKVLSIIEEFHKTVLPFERLSKIYFISHFPRSELGKILKNELYQELQSAISREIKR